MAVNWNWTHHLRVSHRVRIFSPRFFLLFGEIVLQNLQNNIYEIFSPKIFFKSFFLLKKLWGFLLVFSSNANSMALHLWQAYFLDMFLTYKDPKSAKKLSFSFEFWGFFLEFWVIFSVAKNQVCFKRNPPLPLHRRSNIIVKTRLFYAAIFFLQKA